MDGGDVLSVVLFGVVWCWILFVSGMECAYKRVGFRDYEERRERIRAVKAGRLRRRLERLERL